MPILISVKAQDGSRELPVTILGVKPDKHSLKKITGEITNKMWNPLPVQKKDLVSINIFITRDTDHTDRLYYQYKSAVYFWKDGEMQYKSVDGKVFSYSN